ncbi:MAG TPA: hypothetical protein PKA10_08890 [Selenomonadales bacterium]|nr:hypothetical protein [Selenomonadales bacterium]
MARCIRTRKLEVYHRKSDGGNGLDNAEVLCPACREALSAALPAGVYPPAFSAATKQTALRNSGNRCECTRTGGCH